MSFDTNTKTQMFIRCGRLCCLCLKQCGINIEAAHIIDEHKGGSNDEENGIPLCFDCHTEIGSYNSMHPKGNKFRPEELIARRDRVYDLVESGAIYAQLIAQNARNMQSSESQISIPSKLPKKSISAEEKRMLKLLLTKGAEVEAIPRKIGLLGKSSKAKIIDSVINEASTNPKAIEVIGRILVSDIFDDTEKSIAIEVTTRRITLFGSTEVKASLLENVDEENFKCISQEIREAFFEDVLSIIGHDQFTEVNILVPVLVNHTQDIPHSLYAKYVLALVSQTRSDSFKGAPAAKQALSYLSDEMIKAVLPSIDRKFLRWNHSNKELKAFLGLCANASREKQKGMIKDALTLSYEEFDDKYPRSEN